MLQLGTWDVSKVTNMSYMFYGCKNFKDATSDENRIYLWDVSKVTNMSYMFYNCVDFNSELKQWNVSNVTNMSHMFYMEQGNDPNDRLFNQNLNEWDVSSVTDMSYMFYNVSNNTTFNQTLQFWKPPIDVSLNRMFNNLKNIYPSGTLIDGNGTPLYSYFIGKIKLTDETFYDALKYYFTGIVGNFTGVQITQLGNFIINSSKENISIWNVGAVTDMTLAFYGQTNFDIRLNNWDVLNVNYMKGMFYGCSDFDKNLFRWDVSNVTDMNSMFNGATSFNGDISGWNTAALTGMNQMFANATSFNGDISGWDVSNVQYMADFMIGKSTADYDYYDDLLNAWSLLTLQNGVNWEMGSIEYTSAGATARQDIIDNYSWTINDGGEI